MSLDKRGELRQRDRVLEADMFGRGRVDRLDRSADACEHLDGAGQPCNLDVAQDSLDRLRRHELFRLRRLLLASEVVERNGARLGRARRQELVAIGERALAVGFDERRVLQRQEDDRVILERRQLRDAPRIVVALGLSDWRLPNVP